MTRPETKHRPYLSIAVISHNHEPYLQQCIGSLGAAVEGLDAEILVLDNLGRSVQNVLCDANEIPLRVLNNKHPQGFAANVNFLADQAVGDFLLILNPDTTHVSGLLREMIRFLDQEPTAGLVACRLVNQDGTTQQSYRRFPTVPVAISRILKADTWPRRPHFYRYRLMEDEQLLDTSAVDWVFGAFMLVRRQEFRELGGMDARFRLYYEDVDLCYRYRMAELTTHYFPSVVFKHHHLRTSASKPLSRARRWHATSMIRYFTKHRYAFRPPVETRAGLAP